MIRIGLTGNIGTGKSTIARIFSSLQIPVYHADIRSRQLLLLPEVISQLVQTFSDNILNSENQIDRKALASIVFADEGKLNLLNGILHPLVRLDYDAWCTQQTTVYSIHEAAILFESGFNKIFDSTVLVIAPVEKCIQRVMLRDHMTLEQVKGRMAHQWPQEEKQKLAGFVINNDEQHLVIPQVLEIHQKILALVKV